ncbi:hypothetical protein M0804_009660 [Polistes exclamans]|nr:hypothetical protein M0804_009660 [Polistes exclamans]
MTTTTTTRTTTTAPCHSHFVQPTLLSKTYRPFLPHFVLFSTQRPPNPAKVRADRASPPAEGIYETAGPSFTRSNAEDFQPLYRSGNGIQDRRILRNNREDHVDLTEDEDNQDDEDEDEDDDDDSIPGAGIFKREIQCEDSSRQKRRSPQRLSSAYVDKWSPIVRLVLSRQEETERGGEGRRGGVAGSLANSGKDSVVGKVSRTKPS